MHEAQHHFPPFSLLSFLNQYFAVHTVTPVKIPSISFQTSDTLSDTTFSETYAQTHRCSFSLFLWVLLM